RGSAQQQDGLLAFGAGSRQPAGTRQAGPPHHECADRAERRKTLGRARHAGGGQPGAGQSSGADGDARSRRRSAAGGRGAALDQRAARPGRQLATRGRRPPHHRTGLRPGRAARTGGTRAPARPRGSARGSVQRAGDPGGGERRPHRRLGPATRRLGGRVVTVLRLTATATGLLAILAAAPPPAPVEQVAPEAAMSIMGVTVQGPAGKDVGRLTDVLVGLDGKPVAGVIDFGGFLGVGNRKVAVDWKSLKFSPGDKNHPITLELAPDQVRAAPNYKDQQPAPVVKPDAAKIEAAKPPVPTPAATPPAAKPPATPPPEVAKQPQPEMAKQPPPEVAKQDAGKPAEATSQPNPPQPDTTKPNTTKPDTTQPDTTSSDATSSGATQ